MSTSWGAFAVHPSVPANTVAEFVAYAKANPGKLNYGSAGLATITHLFGEMLCLEAGIRMTHVPYRGSAPATNALLAGEIQAQFDQTTLPHIKAGKLRALAMLAEARHPDFPDGASPIVVDGDFGGYAAQTPADRPLPLYRGDNTKVSWMRDKYSASVQIDIAKEVMSFTWIDL